MGGRTQSVPNWLELKLARATMLELAWLGTWLGHKSKWEFQARLGSGSDSNNNIILLIDCS